MAEHEQLRPHFLEHAREPPQSFLGGLARNARADHLPGDEPLQHRRIRLLPGGAGAVGEAVAEGEDDRARVQPRDLRHLLAARRQHERREPLRRFLRRETIRTGNKLGQHFLSRLAVPGFAFWLFGGGVSSPPATATNAPIHYFT